MFNGYGNFNARPGVAYSGGIGPGYPVPNQVLPNGSVEFETPSGAIAMAASVVGAEAAPQEATTTAPGNVPIALDIGGSGVIQDPNGGGGEEGTIYAFMPQQLRAPAAQAGGWLRRSTKLPLIPVPIPNWALVAGLGFVALKAAK